MPAAVDQPEPVATRAWSPCPHPPVQEGRPGRTPGPASPPMCGSASIRAAALLPSVVGVDRTHLPTVPAAALDPLGAAGARAAGITGTLANGLLAGFFASRGAG